MESNVKVTSIERIFFIKAYYYKKVGLVDLSTYGAGRLNLIFGCRGNAGLDGRIQILFSRHEYSSPQGRLSYNNKPLQKFCQKFNNFRNSSLESMIIFCSDHIYKIEHHLFTRATVLWTSKFMFILTQLEIQFDDFACFP